MKEKYGIVVHHREYPGKIVHLCLYEEAPTMNAVKELTLELEHDEEFGIGENIFDLVFRKVTKKELNNLDTIEIWNLDDVYDWK